jgi:adenylosuccinate lyase
VFAARLERELDKLSNFKILVKLNGATGNYNAHFAAYPDVNWVEFTRKFVELLDGKEKAETNEKSGTNQIRLLPNYLTTQVEPADSYAELFDCVSRINTILIDFSQDMWRYISDSWLIQKPKEGEIGSSTMPHKVNPIDFENCEGNLGVANALLRHFSAKLPISRLQRDLSDSTVKRNIGAAFGYCLIGYSSLLKGLGKIDVNQKTVLDALEKHPEVIAEGIQTILRREGAAMPYEKLKELTRGKEVTLEALRTFINSLDVPEKVKEELLRLTPTNYIGIAQRLSKGF